MPLGFLVPAFLFAAAAVALPVYLHLRHRERRTPVRFPSLMFLARIPHRTSDRRRLTHLLLLALRAAAVVLLAIAFARPFLRDETAAASATSSRDVMLVVDRSMSMGYAGVWAAVRDSARRILAGLGPGDRAGLVLADAAAEVAVPLTSERARVTAALAAAEPGPGAGRLGPGLRAAARALADSASARGEIAVLSDYQPSSVAGLEGLALPPGATLTPVLVGPEERGNTAVMGVETARGANGGVEITARAVRFGGAGSRSVRAV
ncbi:MAG TPA: VWA domain-containing protein, partial [Gemmatimonadales bacterium]|nr:VWA domain-containing protein [Gemmatimonadales bacterium]